VRLLPTSMGVSQITGGVLEVRHITFVGGSRTGAKSARTTEL
jgi:hypothetical protein